MALAGTDGAIGESLRPVGVQSPLEAIQGGGSSSGYLFDQTQRAASAFAASRGEPRTVAHLAVAMLDQADEEMGRWLTGAGINADAVRRAALAQIGAPPDLPVIPMPPLTPAGTRDRPALELEELDPRAWRVLTWRQQHLPLSRVRSAANLAALMSWEQRAAERVADQAGVDDDQRYSLLVQHRRAVEDRLGGIRAPVDDPDPRGAAKAGGIARRHLRRVPNFMVGWPTWFANRRVGIRDRWFRLTRAPAYRGQPGLDA
jgi:hypothetical protein